VRYINPDSLNKNPAFTNVVVEGNVKTVHIGGQDAINASGEIVGKGDIVAQTEQILANARGFTDASGGTPTPSSRCVMHSLQLVRCLRRCTSVSSPFTRGVGVASTPRRRRAGSTMVRLRSYWRPTTSVRIVRRRSTRSMSHTRNGLKNGQ
jgi:enamine deaminase RidA (YjgF/YER057c/UK114 family)